MNFYYESIPGIKVSTKELDHPSLDQEALRVAQKSVLPSPLVQCCSATDQAAQQCRAAQADVPTLQSSAASAASALT